MEMHRTSSEASTSAPPHASLLSLSSFSPSLLPSFPFLPFILSSDKHLLCARPYPKPKIAGVNRMYRLYHQETCKLVREAKYMIVVHENTLKEIDRGNWKRFAGRTQGDANRKVSLRKWYWSREPKPNKKLPGKASRGCRRRHDGKDLAHPESGGRLQGDGGTLLWERGLRWAWTAAQGRKAELGVYLEK